MTLMVPQHQSNLSKHGAVVFFGLLGFCLIILGLGVWNVRSSRNASKIEPMALPVSTLTVATKDVVEWFDGFGIATAARSTPVVVEDASRLLERMGSMQPRSRFDPDVREGQVLARLAIAEQDRPGRERSSPDGTTDKGETVLRAPFDGRVENYYLDVGATVVAGTVLCTVVDSNSIVVPVHLPSIVYDHIRVGAACIMSPSGQSGTEWEGTVAKIEPAEDQKARSFTVLVEVEKETQAEPIVAGTRIDARISGPLQHDVIVLPQSVCLGDRVFVVDDGVAHLRTVTIQRFVDDRAVVTGDLSPGDHVIVTPLANVTDGMKVQELSEDAGTQ